MDRGKAARGPSAHWGEGEEGGRVWAERNKEDTGKDERRPTTLAGLRTSCMNPTAPRGWLEMHMGCGQRRLADRPGFEACLCSW